MTNDRQGAFYLAGRGCQIVASKNTTTKIPAIHSSQVVLKKIDTKPGSKYSREANIP
ncbi:hypothetical protein ACFL0Z_02020 [Patescibacteria group bacterium]